MELVATDLVDNFLFVNVQLVLLVKTVQWTSMNVIPILV